MLKVVVFLRLWCSVYSGFALSWTTRANSLFRHVLPRTTLIQMHPKVGTARFVKALNLRTDIIWDLLLLVLLSSELSDFSSSLSLRPHRKLHKPLVKTHFPGQCLDVEHAISIALKRFPITLMRVHMHTWRSQAKASVHQLGMDFCSRLNTYRNSLYRTS